RRKEERGESVFVDYNQMARDRTIASAYSVRARPRATAAAPLRGVEVGDAVPEDFDLGTMPQRLAERGEVHADMEEHAFRLDAVFEAALRVERDLGRGDLPNPPQHPKAAGEPRRVQPSRARRDR